MRHFMRLTVAALCFAPLLSSARAETPLPQTTLEKIRAKGFVQCGTAFRPGIAMVDAKGHWSGLNFELCRAFAVLVLGKNPRFAIHQYDGDADYDPIRKGEDDVAFLSFDEMLGQKLTDKVVPGLPVFIETHDIMVADSSPVRSLADLAGKAVCFHDTSAENASLDAWASETKMPLIRAGFSEEGEMFDAYVVQKCDAIIGESTDLAAKQHRGGPNNLKSRFLPGHLATMPILAVTSVKADSQWAAIVSWTLRTLMAASAHETIHRPDGLRALPVDGAGLGLEPDWQKKLVQETGTYADLFDRNLGAKSPLKLDPGLNAPALDGYVLMSYPQR